MTAPPPVKSPTPARHRAGLARSARPRVAVGAQEVAARRAPDQIPDPRPTTPGQPGRWLTIRAPRTGPATAEAWCVCGWHLTAHGTDHVHQLISLHTDHPATCPTRPEGTTS